MEKENIKNLILMSEYCDFLLKYNELSDKEKEEINLTPERVNNFLEGARRYLDNIN
jgi:hypothetical protein